MALLSEARFETTASPPSFGSFVPASGTISPAQAITITASSSIGLDRVLVWAVFSGDRTELIYDGTAFQDGYGNSSATPGVGTLALSIEADPGWPANFTLNVEAIDDDGNSTNAQAAYAISGAGAPAVGSVSPTAPGTLPQQGTVAFEIDDTIYGELLATFVFAKFPSGRYEVIWDSGEFAAQYANSVATPVTTGGRLTSISFVIQREDGWPESPVTIRAKAISERGYVI